MPRTPKIENNHHSGCKHTAVVVIARHAGWLRAQCTACRATALGPIGRPANNRLPAWAQRLVKAPSLRAFWPMDEASGPRRDTLGKAKLYPLALLVLALTAGCSRYTQFLQSTAAYFEERNAQYCVRITTSIAGGFGGAVTSKIDFLAVVGDDIKAEVCENLD